MSATMERRTPEPGTWLGIPEFPKAAKVGLANAQLRKNLAHATTTINRQDFGVKWNVPLGKGAEEVMVGNDVKIEIDLEVVEKKAEKK